MADFTEDVIDVRDVIERFEQLEASEDRDQDEELEYRELQSLLESLEGLGGDEQWRGSWYPITLIRDDYFRTHAQELAEDIGAIHADASWPTRCIDWDQAASELRMDYSSAEYGGATYWFR